MSVPASRAPADFSAGGQTLSSRKVKRGTTAQLLDETVFGDHYGGKLNASVSAT
jgi:hypothetical protein